MRLGFHYHVPVRLDADGGVRMPGYFGRYVDCLASNCERLVLFLHVATGDADHFDYRLQAENVTLTPIGPPRAVPLRLLGSPLVCRGIARYSDTLDLLLVRAPTPLLGAVAGALHEIPLALLLVGDVTAAAGAAGQNAARRLAIRSLARLTKRQQDRAARRALVLANSRVLAREYSGRARAVVETRTTTLRTEDFFERTDTCLDRPTRLLYTGRLSREKGLEDALIALRDLVESGLDVYWDLVGWASEHDDTPAELMRRAAKMGLSSRLAFHGYKPVGPELFAFYERADIFVIASRSPFEGFPRSLWEAMAHSVPVVATAVGSIPEFLRHGREAILVPPRNPAGLAAGIRRVVEDGPLRRRMIQQGMALARAVTLEATTRQQCDELRRWIRESKA